jgi:predicted transcriptional regulator
MQRVDMGKTQIYVEVDDEVKKKLDELKEELNIPIQGQVDHALEMWFEKAAELVKTMKK